MKVRHLKQGNKFNILLPSGETEQYTVKKIVSYCEICDKRATKCKEPTAHKDMYLILDMDCLSKDGKEIDDSVLVSMLGLTPYHINMTDEQKFLNTEITLC